MLDIRAEERFDRITRTAARLFKVPIALLCLADAHGQSCLSYFGLAPAQLANSAAFCAYLSQQTAPVQIAHLSRDPRFAGDALVGELAIQFYAGWPFATADNRLRGTLCLMDRRVRKLKAGDLEALHELAAWTASELELDQLRRELATQQHSQARSRTERRQIEQALQQAQTKYSTLVEQIPATVYIAEFGEAGVWLYVSPQISNLLGFSPAEWLADSRRWYEQIHPDDRAIVLAAEAESRRNGTSFQCEYRMHTADNRVVWVRDEATPLQNEDGTVPYLQGLLIDVSEQRRAEEILQRQNSHLASLALDNGRLYAAAQNELTQRTHAERALRESEQRYRDLYAAAQRQA
ncbi:MAG TPA: PAS domain-containing protein, partial [Roseiflexaceae bacterium]|nr:PAS domain-containing protein [Roseiflexaceae bacterium]